MRYFKKIIFILLLILSATNLCACGRYSEPSPVKGSGFPHNYPAN